MKKLLPTSVISFVIFLMSAGALFAQDVIIKKDKEEIKGKVIEVGITEMRYKMENNPDGPVFVLRNDDVWKIKYANGTETVISPDKYAMNKEEAILNKTNVIKFDIFSPLTGKLTFGYEHMLKVGTNLEGKIGIIGPHMVGNNDYASGAFIKGGIKFLSGQDFYLNGMRYAHPLKGRYIRLDVIYSTFTSSPEFYYYYYEKSGSSSTKNALAFNICFGKQWILGNTLTLDTFFGVGYGVSSGSGSEDFQYFYSHYGGTSDVPFALSGGLSLGYIL